MIEFPKDRRGYLSPKGYLLASFEQANADGCIQAESEDLRMLYAGLMTATAMNPCDGCPVWDRKGPACKCFQKYHTAYREKVIAHNERLVGAIGPCVKNGEKYEGMSIGEIAAELGISKSEVRRRKVAGTL